MIDDVMLSLALFPLKHDKKRGKALEFVSLWKKKERECKRPALS
jgi:hypothetical protein